MKKIISVLLSVSLFCVSLCVPTAAANTVTAKVSVGEKNIELAPSEGVFYLPAAADVTKVALSWGSGTLSYKSADGAYSGTLKAGQTLELSRAKSTDARGAECYKLTLTFGGESGEYTFYADENLASVFVQTSKGLSYIESSKNNRDKEAKITVADKDGNVEYADTDATASEIKGRGNATWTYYKKPYQIKLSAKTELLGMDKAKTWILLAGYTDQSALHNALAFELGDALDIPYNIEYRFVNLYIDGEYRGLYMLCEKVQIDKSRVNITDLEKATEEANSGTDISTLSQTTVTSGALIKNTVLTSYTYTVGVKSPSDITGGYLVELDNGRGVSEPSHFNTENGNTYVVKSPEYVSKEEMEYIAALFAEIEEAIYSETGYNKKGKHYSEYIDMDSFASVYTVQELLKNWDAFLSSLFFFKDADEGGVTAKIYMGPLWDLDNILGNINFNEEFGTDTAYLWAQNGVFQNYSRKYASSLMKHTDFANAVAKKYQTAYAKTQEYLAAGGFIESSVDEIYSSVMMDRTRWKMYDNDSWLLTSGGYRKSSVKFVWFAEYGTADDTSQETALGFMRYYLSLRADALLTSIGTVKEEEPKQTTEAMSATAQTISSTSAATTAEQSASTFDTSSTQVTEPAASNSGAAPVVWSVFGIAVVLICGAILIITKRKR